MHWDPTSLRLFVRVLETGTIAAVAEQEFIAASAIIQFLPVQLKTFLDQHPYPDSIGRTD